jgi:hypothetical protein
MSQRGLDGAVGTPKALESGSAHEAPAFAVHRPSARVARRAHQSPAFSALMKRANSARRRHLPNLSSHGNA